MDAFDADVLIYAAIAEHPLGTLVRELLAVGPDEVAGVGSVLLLPEVLTKPIREGAHEAVDELTDLLLRLELVPLDQATARLATSLGARYGLRAADAVHLATAVAVGAERFLTNNRRDFTAAITEVDVTYPDQLGEAPSLG